MGVTGELQIDPQLNGLVENVRLMGQENYRSGLVTGFEHRFQIGFMAGHSPGGVIVDSSYLQGIEYLNLAETNFDDGNYTGASDNAFEAIQLFGDAFERVQDLTPVEPDDVDDDDGDDETGNPDRLAVAIERAFAYLEKLIISIESRGPIQIKA